MKLYFSLSHFVVIHGHVTSTRPRQGQGTQSFRSYFSSSLVQLYYNSTVGRLAVRLTLQSMAWINPRYIFYFFLLTVCSQTGQCCKKGFAKHEFKAVVPPQVLKGKVVLKVKFNDCSLGEHISLHTNDFNFGIHSNGKVYATHTQNISSTYHFKVLARDLKTHKKWKVPVILVPSADKAKKVLKEEVPVIYFRKASRSRRQKREWIIPPIDVREHEPPMRNPIGSIFSDIEQYGKLTYALSGPGADQPPVNMFVIDPYTGNINITGQVDRELNPEFRLTGQAWNSLGQPVEKPLSLVIKVQDINDNAPVFAKQVFEGSVEELSQSGTFVLALNATDRDEGENAQIAYRILSQGNEMSVTKYNGDIKTTTNNLDRETQDLYTLVVEARDMNGKAGGLYSTANVQIKILDVNDNIPTIEKEEYEASVQENTLNDEVTRIKVFDEDQEFTDNWLGNFEIIEGNEDGHFRFEIDEQTNEGILVLQKELDYEEASTRTLLLRVSNKAAYHSSLLTGGGGGGGSKPVKLKINVMDQKEGFSFKPTKKRITLSENKKKVHIGQKLGRYPAFSADTGKESDRVRYAKGSDPANFFNINPDTSEITLAKLPDRESEHVVNGRYTATVLAIDNDGGSPITSTGTILINVEDVNDNIPNFDNLQPCMCSHAKYLNVTASDADGVPFGAPFRFNVQSEQTWKLGPTDATSMQLVPLQDLWPGVFSVPVWIEDNNGKGHTVTLDVTVSDCHGTDHCSSERLVQSKAELGGLAVALMILPLLLLLLLPLLLVFCKCGSGFYGKPGFLPVEGDRTDGTLGQSSIEGGGQVDTMIPLVPHPGRLDVVQPSEEWVGKAGKSFGLVGLSSAYVNGSLDKGARWTVEGSDGTCKTDLMTSLDYGKSAWSHDQYLKWLSTRSTEGIDVFKGAHKTRQYIGQYINQKVHAITQEWTSQSLNDCLLVYNREGSNSPVGSLDCCNLIEESPLDDSFLNDLDPKFRMLAEICSGQSMKEISEVVSSQSWEQKSSPRPLIQQEEVVKKEIVSSSSVMQQHSDFNPLSLKKHYIVTTTIQPSQEEPPFVGDQSGVTSRHEEFQTVSITTDPAMAQKMAVTKVDYGPGGFQGIVPSFTTTPAAQKNVVVVRSGLGGIQSMAADPSTGQGSQMQKTVVVTSSVNTGSEGVQEMLTNQMIGQVPVTHENSVVTGPVNAGLRETLDHSYINKQAIEKNVTTSKSNSGMYKSVKKTTKVVQLVQE
ncbi:desmoglein-3-like [Pristis pectinata]|uniref:desmoglein-3-like n=1 Tax=Pristis pectinata TaxID=685728 RepID=UPI00223DCD2A|nr:desmoglein-3-like [Pristis pectinata]